MKLSDLKTGMAIRTTKGSNWMVNEEAQKCFNMNNDGSYIRFDNLNEDLSHKTLPVLNVTRVRCVVVVDHEIIRA